MPDSLFCPIRKKWVAALPEEKIRQALVQEMIQNLGYPLSLMALEKRLVELPHLKTHNPSLFPKRRTDLIIFSKDIHPNYVLYPLLLIECKAVPLTNKVLRQIVGYNQYVKARFIAAVNQRMTYFGWYHKESQDFVFQEGILPYDQLVKKTKS